MRIAGILLAATITSCIFLVGCNQGENTSSTRAAIESSAALTSEVTELKKKVSDLELKVTILEYSQDPNKTATIDPADTKGYQRIDANVGTFLVAVENVEPYLDGQRITLLIGNPNNLNFSGFQLKVKWGKRMPDFKNPPGGDFNTAFDAYKQSTKEKEITFTETLKPGMWNKVKFTIPQAPAADFGRLELSITTNQVQLISGR